MRAIQQYLKSDCAAACLVYIACHHGLDISLAMARRLAGTSRAGTTALGLVQAAEKLGLTAKGVRGDADFLETCPKPAVAHVTTPSGRKHYVVLLKCRAGRVRVFDPDDGKKRWHPRDAFTAIWSGIAIILAPGKGFELHERTVPPFRRLLRMLLGHKATLVQLLAGAVLLSGLGLTMSFYVQRVVDDVIPEANGSLLNLLGVAMVVLIVSRLVVGWFQFVLSAKLAQRIDSTLILGYYRHLLRLPQSFFESMRIGEMTSRISDAIQIRSFLSSVFVSTVLNPIILVSCLGAMFLFSPKLAALALTQFPLQLLVYLWLNRLNRKYQRATKELAADLNSHVTETLHTISTVKRFSQEETAAARTEAHFVRLLRTTWASGMEGFFCTGLSAIGSQLYALAILWFGASLVLRADLTPGELMSCYSLSLYISGSLGGLIGLSSDLQQAMIATDRLFEIMDEAPEPEGGTVTLTPELIGAITLDHVTLRYPGKPPALRDVSLVIPAGKMTAITGESGSGKSTLLAVLQRLYPPESGLIKIGQIDFDYVATSSLRSELAVLPQRVELLAGSILTNIAPSDPSPDMARVADLCVELGILDFINSLPLKFRSPLGEGGLSLSGGQRQKIALARTFYRRAPIVLLDEPTAALDREATRRVAMFLQKCRAQGMTIVTVTHSRAIIDAADTVLVFKNGAVASRGAARPAPVSPTAAADAAPNPLLRLGSSPMAG